MAIDSGNIADTMVKCDISFCNKSVNGYCVANGNCDYIDAEKLKDMVNHPNHYAGKIEVIDYIRDKLTPQGFTEYCCGNVLKYVSRWQKKDGVQDLKKAKVYLDWMIESAEKE